MLSFQLIVQSDEYKNLLESKTELPTYKELVTELKQYLTVGEIKDVLHISESTHNRYLNGADVIFSIKLHLFLTLQYFKALPK